MNQPMLLLEYNFNGIEVDLNETNIAKGLLKFRGKFQEAECVNKNKRLYPFGVLDENIQRLKDVVDSRGLVGELDHPCWIDNNFQVLTPKGFREFKEIRVGDYVYSRINGQMVESRVNEVIDTPYDGPVYKVKGRSIDCVATPEHKFLLVKRQDHKKSDEEVYATIEEIHDNREKYSHNAIPKTATWKGNNNSKININGLIFDTNKFAAFLGIYLAEGNPKNKAAIQISQTNEVGKNLISKLLNSLHPEIKWTEHKNHFYVRCPQLYDYLAPLGNKYTKYIPQEIKQLSSSYLEELITWFAIGDGTMLSCSGMGLPSKSSEIEDKILWNNKYGRNIIYTTSKQLIEDLHECLIKTGRCGSLSVETCKKDYVYAGRIIRATNKKPLYKLNISKSKYIHTDPRFLSITQRHHTGRKYCLSTEYGNFYMKYKGKSFWTGNCDSIIHFKEASHIITKLWWDGNILMGEGEILSTAHGRQLKELLNSGVRVGISSRGVGNGKVNENGVLVIGESYKLITFDAVADPSTFSAFQEKVITGKKESIKPQPILSNCEEKNKNERIYKLTKEAVVAAFSGIIKEQTNKIKERLG